MRVMREAAPEEWVDQGQCPGRPTLMYKGIMIVVQYYVYVYMYIT